MNGQLARIRINVESLEVGAVLPLHICDHVGRVLLTAGTRVRKSHLDRLGIHDQQGLFVGTAATEAEADADADAVDQSEPTDIYKRLKAQRDKQVKSDARQHVRRTWNVLLTLAVEECGGALRREIDVTTLDVSARGFAFAYKQFIYPGTKVRARFETLPDRPALSGIVRYCRSIGGTHHRVGVQFIRR